MSLPHLLLVDDSETILAFEKAVLSGHYAITTANNGMEALEKAGQQQPEAILLDLSMPVMDGGEVLARLKSDPKLEQIPVIVISTEAHRAESTLKAGASAFLPKPIKTDALLSLVDRVLADDRRRRRRGSLGVLFVGIGPLEVAFPLDMVRIVVLQPAMTPLAGGPLYMSHLVEIYGKLTCVMDLGERFGVSHQQSLAERKLVVVHREHLAIALCVDWVRDPEEFPAAQVIPRERLGGSEHGLLKEALIAVVQASNGPVAVLDPLSLLSPDLLGKLPQLIEEAKKRTAA